MTSTSSTVLQGLHGWRGTLNVCFVLGSFLLAVCIGSESLLGNEDGKKTKDDIRLRFTLTGRVHAPFNRTEKEGALRNTFVIEVNDIPVEIARWGGVLECGLNLWVGRGKNRVRISGPRQDVAEFGISEATRSLGDFTKFKSLDEVRMTPGDAEKVLEFDADVPWARIEADGLDVSGPAAAKIEGEILACLRELELAQLKKDSATLQQIARSRLLPGIIRGMESCYARRDRTDAEVDTLAQRLSLERVNPGERKADEPNAKYSFIHGKRGVLVYRGFYAVTPEHGEEFPYVYRYTDRSEGKVFEHRVRPFVFVRWRGKWHIL